MSSNFMFKLDRTNLVARCVAIPLIGRPGRRIAPLNDVLRVLAPAVRAATTEQSGAYLQFALWPRLISPRTALALAEWRQGMLIDATLRSVNEGEAADARVDCELLEVVPQDGVCLAIGVASQPASLGRWIDLPSQVTWDRTNFARGVVRHWSTGCAIPDNCWFALRPMGLHEAAWQCLAAQTAPVQFVDGLQAGMTMPFSLFPVDGRVQ